MPAGIPQTGDTVPDDAGLAIDEATGLAKIVQRVGVAGHDQ